MGEGGIFSVSQQTPIMSIWSFKWLRWNIPIGHAGCRQWTSLHFFVPLIDATEGMIGLDWIERGNGAESRRQSRLPSLSPLHHFTLFRPFSFPPSYIPTVQSSRGLLLLGENFRFKSHINWIILTDNEFILFEFRSVKSPPYPSGPSMRHNEKLTKFYKKNWRLCRFFTLSY